MDEPLRDEHDNAPRIWPTLLALLGVPVLAFIAAGVAILVYSIARGLTADQIDGVSPEVSGLGVLATSSTFVLAALSLGALSPEPIRSRLRLQWPPRRHVLLFVLATPAITGFSSLVDVFLFPEPTPYMKSMIELFQAPFGIAALVLYVATLVGAPLGEELFFRGYAQTRLERRLPLGIAILIPAIVFTLIHMHPQHMIGVFPFALWAGYAVWHTQSVFVTILCHAYYNVLSVVFAQLTPPTAGSGLDDPTFIPLMALAAVSTVPLVLAVRLPRGSLPISDPTSRPAPTQPPPQELE